VVETWLAAIRQRDMEGGTSKPFLRHRDVRCAAALPSSGLEAYRKTWDLFYSWTRDPVLFEPIEMSVTAGANVAFVVATVHCAGSEANTEPDVLDFRLTMGLRKIDDRWTIMHEHHSVPAVD
jgi:ketosteroid isomerase-like protein